MPDAGQYLSVVALDFHAPAASITELATAQLAIDQALIDRQSGKCVMSVTYDSREAMDRMRDRATNLRGTGAQEAGAEILDVAEFEFGLGGGGRDGAGAPRGAP